MVMQPTSIALSHKMTAKIMVLFSFLKKEFFSQLITGNHAALNVFGYFE